MQRPIFGRKGLGGAPAPLSLTPPDEPPHPGHQAALAHLRQLAAEGPLARPRHAGRILFDFVYQTIAEEDGARPEDLLAILAATGGIACIAATLQLVRSRGQTLAGAGIFAVDDADGGRYYTGEPARALLADGELSLFGLALGSVAIEMVEAAFRRAGDTAGGPAFGVPDLPEPHRPRELPTTFGRYAWPKVRETLDLCEVAAEQRATVIGFALQHALAGIGDALDAGVAARIVVQYAVSTAKLDPARFD